MADVKITQLPAALSVNDTDNLILDDGSSTYRVAANLLKEYMTSDIPADIDAAVAAANKNLAPAYNASSKYAVGDLCTYQGKLYKCIAPVTSPEAFNIIKWDDVTASESFTKKDILINSVAADGVKTIRNILDELCAGITFNLNSEYTVRVELNIGVNYSYHTRDVRVDTLECCLASVVKDASAFEELNLKTSGDSEELKFTTFAGSTPPKYENISTTFVPKDRTYKLYEMPL